VFNSGTYLEYTDTVKTLVQVTFGIIENTHIVWFHLIWSIWR